MEIDARASDESIMRIHITEGGKRDKISLMMPEIKVSSPKRMNRKGCCDIFAQNFSRLSRNTKSCEWWKKASYG